MNALALSLSSLLAAVATPAPAAPAKVARHTRFEATFQAQKKYEAPLHDVGLEVTFTSPSGKAHIAQAFHFEDDLWKVRFSPDETGAWTFRTRASKPDDSGLHDRSGGFTCVPYTGSNPLYKHGPLRLSDDRRSFVHADGTPFFFLADTAWNGPMKSDRKSWDQYLRFRATQGYNVIQYVTTQWRTASGNADGRPAFYGREKIELDPEFWKWMDERVDAMNDRGFVAAAVLIWAIAGRTAPLNPGQYLPDDQIAVLARHQVARYGAHHATWFLAGDGKYLDKEAERWRKIGRAVFGTTPPRQPTTMHPGGRTWVYGEFKAEPWFTYNGYQSSHGGTAETLSWIVAGPPSRDWSLQPAHPHINLEPNYEGHVQGKASGVFTDFHVRRASYWSVLVHPPAGVAYGGQGVWSWELQPRPPMTHPYTGVARPWNEAMKLPGAAQLGHLKKLFTSLPWPTLRPAQELVAVQPGNSDPARTVVAARTADGKVALVYVPEGGVLTLAADQLKAPATASWFDPVTGRSRPAGKVPATGTRELKAPSPRQDWVLVLR